MNFVYYMPTKVVCGRNCVRECAAELKTLGRHALVVTGKSSAKNGALADVRFALESNGQGCTVFDKVTPNPTVSCVKEGVKLLKSSGADFIVAVGGGSPMDAAKAIASLALQPRGDDEIFGEYEAVALPMAHIPTTAGTGSEVTPYSILTNDKKQTKTSIKSPAMFPKVAFLDGKYMEDLPAPITVNTALDAFSHAAESILSNRTTPLSEALAEEALRILYPILQKTTKPLTLEERDALLYASMLGGMAIAQTGTTAVHGMGYSLTYFCDIDHGRANGLLLGETLRLCEEKGAVQLEKLLRACGCTLDELFATFDKILGKRESIPREQLEDFALRSLGSKGIAQSVYAPTAEEVRRIFLRSFGFEA